MQYPLFFTSVKDECYNLYFFVISMQFRCALDKPHVISSHQLIDMNFYE